jgi:hypothetical protein
VKSCVRAPQTTPSGVKPLPDGVGVIGRLAMHGRYVLLAVALCSSAPLAAQAVPRQLARDRAEYLTWLRTAPTSPFAAIALQRVGPGITLGPAGSDVVLEGMPQVRVSETGGRALLDSAGVSRALPRDRVVTLGRYRLLLSGAAGRGSATVFTAPRDVRAPVYFPYLARAADTVTLVPPADRRTVVLLAPEGTDVDADEAGTVTVTRFGAPVALKVRRFPGASEDEPELEIYFRDASNGHGSYPAGRFVSLEPVGNGKFLLDFNRARNPFCAYSSVFPCPAPWQGNAIAVPVEAGEMYQPGPKPQ